MVRSALAALDAGGTAGEAGRVARESLMLTGGLAVTWVASLAIRLLLPNFLDPAAFGRLVFAESLALLLFALLTLGIDTYARRELASQPDLYRRLMRPLAVARGAAPVIMAATGVVVLGALGRPSSVVALFACYAAAQFLVNGGLVAAAFLQGGGRAASVTVTQVVTKLLWAVLALGGLTAGVGPMAIPLPWRPARRCACCGCVAATGRCSGGRSAPTGGGQGGVGGLRAARRPPDQHRAVQLVGHRLVGGFAGDREVAPTAPPR
ncbi:MAG: hypothetical protein R2755_22580 [Acidimicrobiales bacterium]